MKKDTMRPNTSALDHDVSHDFSTRAKGLLRFAIQFGSNSPCIAEGNRKLVLRLPLRFFTRTQQCFLWTACIDLNHDPAQLSRIKVEYQRTVRPHRTIHR